MNLENILKDCMKEDYARQICDWKYEGEYEDYNLPSYDECREKKYGITREDRKDLNLCLPRDELSALVAKLLSMIKF